MIERLLIVGVSNISDLYPNVKYKIKLLASIPKVFVEKNVFDLPNGQGFGALYFNRRLAKIIGVMRIIIGHLVVIFRTASFKGQKVYICYPGIFLVLALAAVFGKGRFVFYLDAFISVYDTLVNDRQLITAHSWAGKLLYRLEKKAFHLSRVVFVDTPENGDYYASLFGLPIAKFQPLPLSIPDVVSLNVMPSLPGSARSRGEVLTVLFFGTMVPLQGIKVVLNAERTLRDKYKVRFIIIGDGQEGKYVREAVKNSGSGSLVWMDKNLSTKELVKHIQSADVCLGVFGESPKAKRVIPYKVYYYLALGKPVITARTPPMEQLLSVSGVDVTMQLSPLLLCQAGNSNSLVKCLIEIMNEDSGKTVKRGAVSRRIYDDYLALTNEKKLKICDAFGFN